MIESIKHLISPFLSATTKEAERQEMRKRLIEYYDRLTAHYAEYHSHKEILSWSGLVLFMAYTAFIIQLNVEGSSQQLVTIIIALTSIIFGLLVDAYINNQLNMKAFGGDHHAAAMLIRLKLVNGEITDKELDGYTKVNRNASENSQAAHVLPEKLLTEAKRLKIQGSGFAGKTKSYMRAMLLFLVVIIITVKFLQCN